MIQQDGRGPSTNRDPLCGLLAAWVMGFWLGLGFRVRVRVRVRIRVRARVRVRVRVS